MYFVAFQVENTSCNWDWGCLTSETVKWQLQLMSMWTLHFGLFCCGFFVSSSCFIFQCKSTFSCAWEVAWVFLVQCLSFLKHCTMLSKNWKLETENLLTVPCPFQIEETWGGLLNQWKSLVSALSKGCGSTESPSTLSVSFLWGEGSNQRYGSGSWFLFSPNTVKMRIKHFSSSYKYEVYSFLPEWVRSLFIWIRFVTLHCHHHTKNQKKIFVFLFMRFS